MSANAFALSAVESPTVISLDESIIDLDQEQIGVILVDHRRMVRASMEAFIAQQSDLEVIGQASNATTAIELLKDSPVDDGIVIVVDLDASDGAGLNLVRTIEQDFPNCTVVGFGRGEDVAAVARAFYAGVSAFVDANVDPAELVAAIRAAGAGDVVVKGLSRQALPRLAQEIEKLKSGGPRLTERECQILQVAAEGLAAQDIAQRIGISVRTVTTHLSHIYSKLGVHSRVAAIAAATKGGYLLSQPTES